MELKTTKQIASLLSKTTAIEGQRYRLEKHINHKKLSGFHQWADDRPCKEAFLFKGITGDGLWLLLVDWRKKQLLYRLISGINVWTNSRNSPRGRKGWSDLPTLPRAVFYGCLIG